MSMIVPNHSFSQSVGKKDKLYLYAMKQASLVEWEWEAIDRSVSFL